MEMNASKGMCWKHYTRLLRHGDPLATNIRKARERDGDIAAFHAGYRKGREDECWWWQLGKASGYGRIQWRGRAEGAHRIAFEVANGRKPEGLVRHTCDNPPCVNPAHLLEGTHQDNIRDAAERKRMVRGEAHHQSVLTETSVRSARQLRADGISYQRIADSLGVAKRTIWLCCNGRTWREVD